MATNNNADEYAAARIGIFFQGFPAELTGQCVSLVKWFLQEMCSVPDPQAARGNAKDYGDNLVAQGIADRVVSDGDRQQGDIVVWRSDGGGYGHIGILLSGDRVFEENVGIAGSRQAVYGGNVVYASRIDPLYQSWRKGAPTFYRVKTYVGNGDIMDRDGVVALYRTGLHREPENDDAINGRVGMRSATALDDFRRSDEWLGQNHKIVYFDQVAKQLQDTDALRQQAEANSNAAKITADQAVAAAAELKKSNDELKAQLALQSEDTKTLNGFGEYLRKLIVRLGVK